MTIYIPIGEITPVTDYGRKECPFDCVGCKYFGGIHGDDIECNLPMEDDFCKATEE